MVLFLVDRRLEELWLKLRHQTWKKLRYLLEVKGEIGGNDTDFKQMLDSFKLALLKVLEDVQVLHREEMRWTNSGYLPPKCSVQA